MTPLFKTVRAATRAAHDALEVDVALERRLADLGSYRALLARFYGLYAALARASPNRGSNSW